MGKLNKKQIVFILAVILTILRYISISPYEKQTAKVTRIIDGDTIEIEKKIIIRYIGINSPEIYHDSTGKKTGEQCFARESYLENKKLVEGKIVTLVKDISDKDKYGRLLRYIYVNDEFVNSYLVKNGFAKIMTIKPDIKYSQQFKTDEKEAKTKNLGIWNKCK